MCHKVLGRRETPLENRCCTESISRSITEAEGLNRADRGFLAMLKQKGGAGDPGPVATNAVSSLRLTYAPVETRVVNHKTQSSFRDCAIPKASSHGRSCAGSRSSWIEFCAVRIPLCSKQCQPPMVLPVDLFMSGTAVVLMERREVRG